MFQRTISSSLQAKIFEKFDNKCHICEYSIKQTLIVHHIIPGELWGKDSYDENNLVLICANCHKIVHRFAAKKYKGVELAKYLSAELQEKAIKKVEQIIRQAREFQQKVKRQGNIVENPYTVKEAASIVARKNGFTDEKHGQISHAIKAVIDHIPEGIKKKCSYRLLKKGKYISISLMNYLLFRTPGYGDFGEIPVHECLMSFPLDNIPPEFTPIDPREPFHFKFVEVVNIGVSYSEILKISKDNWKPFAKAIQMIDKARKTRNWISNIDFQKSPFLS